MKRFDLIEYQDRVRTTKSPRKLFELWSEVCWFYDHGYVGRYQLDEMKAVVWPHLHSLCSLQTAVDRSFRQSA